MTEDEIGQLVTPDFSGRRVRATLRRWRPLLIVGLVVVLLAGTGWVLYFSSWLAVRKVDVTGNSLVPTARIVAIAQVKLGQPLVRVDLAAIQARVETIPAVRSVDVSRSWPHDISIAVTERVAVAVVSRGSGLQSLDADGVLFGHYRHVPAGLPKVTTAPNVSAAALVEAARVVTSLRADIAARVRDIVVTTVDKITLDLKGGITVQWGSAADSENKAAVLAILLRKKVKQIDVSVPGRPTTR